MTGRQQFSNYVVFMSSWKSPHKSNKFCKSRVFLHEAASPSTIQKSRHDQKGVKLWPSREQIKFLAIKVLQKGVSLFHWGELLRSVIFKNYFSVVLWDLISVFPAISLDPNWCYSIHSKYKAISEKPTCSEIGSKLNGAANCKISPNFL